jgi:hypothetical protein
MLNCFEQRGQLEPPTTCDCKVLDRAVIVHCLPTTGTVSFSEYADTVCIRYLEKQLQHVTMRLDVLWDMYIPDSLHESTQEKRGNGLRKKLFGQTKLLGYWGDFLQDSEN